MKSYYFVIRYTVDKGMIRTKVYRAKEQSPTSYIERIKRFYDDDEIVDILSINILSMNLEVL